MRTTATQTDVNGKPKNGAIPSNAAQLALHAALQAQQRVRTPFNVPQCSTDIDFYSPGSHDL